MLCCGCKKQHGPTRTALLDPSVSNNFLYQQHLHLHQQNQQNAAIAAAAAAAAAGMPPQTSALLAAAAAAAATTPTPGGGTMGPGNQLVPGNIGPGTQLLPAGGQQRYVGGINYVMQQQHPSYHQVVPQQGGQGRGYLANSSTGIFTKQPSSTMYASMIFPQDGRQSRIVPDMVALQPESFRRVSGITSEVFRQIEAVEAEFDPSQLAAQYAEMERRGEMIIRILNPAGMMPIWLEETCRRYGDGIRIPNWVQFVEVIKRPGQTLGLYIREGDAMYTTDGVYISRIALESPVYQSGCLRVGDEILAVNFVDVQRMSLDDVVIIMSIPRRLILTIRSRPLNATGVDHMLPSGNRMYGSESYYDTVASDIYSRVDDLRKPVVVLKQQLEDEELAAEVEAEAEAIEAAASVAAALDAATAAAEVGLLDAAEIAAASVDLVRPPLRHRSGSLDIYDLEMKAQTGGPVRALANRRKLFNNTADNLAELAMADAAYAYARRRSGSSLSGYGGGTGSLDRPSSRLSTVTLPSGRSAALLAAKGGKSATSSLYHGRLASSRARSATGRLLRTSSDLFLGPGQTPDDLMDRALLQAAASGRRHSLTHSDSGGDDRQLDILLQRYQNLRQMRGRRPQSLDRAYKSSLRNSFSSQTLQGGMMPPGGATGGFSAQHRLESILAARRGRGPGSSYDAYSDTEAYDTPSSLLARRAMTPSSLLPYGAGSGAAARSSSLPRHGGGGGGARGSRTAALNQRLAQLEQFYAATAAAARHHTLTGHGARAGGSSRPHSALAGSYSDREDAGNFSDGTYEALARRDRLGLQLLQRQQQRAAGVPPLALPGRTSRDDSVLDSKMARVPSTSAIYETVRKSKLGQDMMMGAGHGGQDAEMMMQKASSLPRHKSYHPDDPRAKELNQELNARFASRHINESYGSKAISKDDEYELLRATTTGPSSSTTPRPLMIDPSGFQQYGPELRTAAAQHQRSGDEQAGYSGLLVIHLLGVRGLHVDPSAPAASSISAQGVPTSGGESRNLYCVVECDRVYKARTVAVQSHESNSMNFDWDEIFDIDMFDTKEVTFLFYTWNPSSRHKLCSKGTIHLPWISTLRSQHVHAFEMRLYETPGAMLYIKLEFHDLRTTFKRSKRDPKQPRRGSRLGTLQLQNEHPLFGMDLDSVLARENSGFSVPIILKRCTEEIELRGLHLVGIYRLCGSAIRKKHLREHFERNAWLADLSQESVPDINVITSK